MTNPIESSVSLAPLYADESEAMDGLEDPRPELLAFSVSRRLASLTASLNSLASVSEVRCLQGREEEHAVRLELFKTVDGSCAKLLAQSLYFKMITEADNQIHRNTMDEQAISPSTHSPDISWNGVVVYRVLPLLAFDPGLVGVV